MVPNAEFQQRGCKSAFDFPKVSSLRLFHRSTYIVFRYHIDLQNILLPTTIIFVPNSSPEKPLCLVQYKFLADHLLSFLWQGLVRLFLRSRCPQLGRNGAQHCFLGDSVVPILPGKPTEGFLGFRPHQY